MAITSLTVAGQVFNRGIVTLNWEVSDLSSGDSVITEDRITYEIEYTENFDGDNTDWHTLERRIQFSTNEYIWVVGKMIKSDNVRMRIRTVASNLNIVSDWAMTASFAINVYILLAPAIVNPLPNTAYSDFILIILDETLTAQTYNQKVRYTLEYSSDDQDVGWTAIAQDLPPGNNVIRWNIEDVEPADDYILRLTAKDKDSHQFAYNFIYNLTIRQSGLFYIDTKPPDGLLEVESGSAPTNSLRQTISVFAEDDTTEVEKIQIRECDADSILRIGDIESLVEEDENCPPITELESLTNFGKPIGYSSKLQWNLEDSSGLKKLEALLTDSGGNTSLQIQTKNFLKVFENDFLISDFLITTEQREDFTISDDSSPSIAVETKVVEIVYLVTYDGELWVLEPYSRLIYTINNVELIKIYKFNGTIYLFGYNSSNNSVVYRHDGDEATLIQTFAGSKKITDVAEFSSTLYIGFDNGDVWAYDGTSFSFLENLSGYSIKSMHGDENYLYVGFLNEDMISFYDGTAIRPATLNDVADTNQIYSSGDDIYAARSNGKILKGEKPIWDVTFKFESSDILEDLTIREHENQSAEWTSSGLYINGATVRI